MSYHWEPKWVRRKLVIEGVTIETCIDLTTGMLVCPACVDIDSLCPSEDRPSTALPKGTPTFFFTVIDLLRHMKAHRESAWRKRVEEEEEAEEEFVEGESEE